MDIDDTSRRRVDAVENLDHLLRAGIAGAPVRVVITTIGESEPLRGELREEEPRLFPRDSKAR